MAESDAVRGTTAKERLSARTRSVLLWAAALAALVIGFADLVRGGTTVAPVLLVLGYCVLVPIAILK